MDIDFDPTLLMLSLVPSGVGWVLFTYGRKEQRWPQLCCGIALMVYPYFAGSMATLVGGGVLVSAALYVMLAVGL
jgi:hypothetical protein